MSATNDWLTPNRYFSLQVRTMKKTIGDISPFQVTRIWLAILFITFGSWCSCSAQETQAADRRPNIVFLLTDDQATITMGCYGSKEAKTPNLDKLANAGVVFDNHYVTTAICMASRASIMTGLYEYRTGCNFGRGRMSAENWSKSYPLLLREAGYRIAFAGKFGFQVEGMDDLPSKDFDKWGGGPGQTFYETAKNKSLVKYAERYPHSSTAYGAFGQDFIRESVAANKPFCLSISFKAPHRPVSPDPKFDDVYKNTVFEKPQNFGRKAGEHLAWQSRTGRQYPRFESWGYSDNYNSVMQKYNQQVYGVDQAVGMISAELERQGVAHNTVVFFTSDNGFLCGSHGYGSKVLPYEESARVPLIIFDPRRPTAKRGVRTRALTGSIDLAPTILQLAGLKQIEGVDGKSLLPLLENQHPEVRESLALMNFWGPETTHSFGVVTREWKYLFWYSQENEMVATEELFDIIGDRLEMTNLAYDEAHLSDLNQMREQYAELVYRIAERAINEDYRKYGILFDRKQPWDIKKKVLDKRSTKDGF